MLAMKNKDGEVFASVGGLAHQSRISKEKTRESLEKFMAPEQDSSSRDDGRRIEEIPGGWRLLNHDRVKAEAQAASRASYMQVYMKGKRGKDPQKLSLRAKIQKQVAEDPTTIADAKAMRKLNKSAAATKEPTTMEKEYDLDDDGDTQP
jgi:hypothetical protein